MTSNLSHPSVGEQLLDAAELLGIGMVAVFAFLSLLILAIVVLSKFAPPVEAPVAAKPAAKPVQTTNNTAVMAAITAAVHQYRKAQ
ncbi:MULTISPECIES: OadG family protein [Aliagarivorans]|uniref:OadG family protein n=1 Tax=Aliagarivorans TaxID=882379 RepID=UPI00047A244E|nr:MULTISPECIES: OadG family transporter subunit [Aliagarivorans]